MQSSTATKTAEDAQPERSDTEMLGLSQTPELSGDKDKCPVHGSVPGPRAQTTGAPDPNTCPCPSASPKGRAKGCSHRHAHNHTKAASDPLRESFFKGTI